MAKVIGICSRIKEKAPMVVFTSAKVSFAHGIGDDSRGLIRGDRQVTVMTQEGWDDACKDLGSRLHWTTRRANILIGGLDLEDTKGLILKIGSFYLEITGELKPGGRMDEERVGLKKALTPNWRGGVTCKIISEGMVNENDEVKLMERS